MNIKEKINELKIRREKEKELRRLESKEFEKQYAVRAKKEALKHAKLEASEKAKSRLVPTHEKIISRTGQILHRADEIAQKTGNIFSKAQQKPYGRYPNTTRPKMQMSMGKANLLPTEQRRFVEVGDTRTQPILSASIEGAFFGSGTSPINKGGIVEAFYGPSLRDTGEMKTRFPAVKSKKAKK